MYGSGLRLLEVLQLRVKDLDFGMGEIVVRRAKGAKDRVTMLPGAVVPELEAHLERVRRVHQRDLAEGGGRVALPGAFERKSPHAARQEGYRAHFLNSDASGQMLRSLQRHFGRLFWTVNRCWLIVSYGASAGGGIVTDIWAALGGGYVVAEGGPMQSNSS